MTGAEILAVASLASTLLLGVFVLLRDWWKAKAEARAVDAQARSTDSTIAATEVETEDRIAERRLVELNRLYKQVADLEIQFREFKAAASKKDRAIANVLRDAAEQWPKEEPGPVFSDEDIAVLEDTLPHQWRRRLRPK